MIQRKGKQQAVRQGFASEHSLSLHLLLSAASSWRKLCFGRLPSCSMLLLSSSERQQRLELRLPENLHVSAHAFAGFCRGFTPIKEKQVSSTKWVDAHTSCQRKKYMTPSLA